MILAVAHTKGGVGKSMLATNLAIWRAAQDRKVVLVDADEQASSDTFTALRAEMLEGKTGYLGVQLTGGTLRSQVRNLAALHDDIVIDVGGTDSAALRAALTVADRVLVPCVPRTFDVWAMEKLSAILIEAKAINERLHAIAFVNMADAQGQDNAEARAAIAGIQGIDDVSKVVVGRRKAFPNAVAAGRGVIEMKPRDPVAVQELTAIAQIAFSIL